MHVVALIGKVVKSSLAYMDEVIHLITGSESFNFKTRGKIRVLYNRKEIWLDCLKWHYYSDASKLQSVASCCIFCCFFFRILGKDYAQCSITPITSALINRNANAALKKRNAKGTSTEI